MARPTKLTKELQEKLVQLLEDGQFVRLACEQVGINEKTFFRWLEESQEDDASEDLKAFSQACARARAKAVEKLLSKAEAMATEGLDYKLFTWQLERLFPSIFHLSTKSEVSGPNGKPVQIENVGVVVLPALAPLPPRPESDEGDSD